MLTGFSTNYYKIVFNSGLLPNKFSQKIMIKQTWYFGQNVLLIESILLRSVYGDKVISKLVTLWNYSSMVILESLGFFYQLLERKNLQKRRSKKTSQGEEGESDTQKYWLIMTWGKGGILKLWRGLCIFLKCPHFVHMKLCYSRSISNVHTGKATKWSVIFDSY